MLENVDLDRRLSKARWQELLPPLQERLRGLQYELLQAEIPTVIVFEGWDAAGKGTTIHQLGEGLDPRAFRAWPGSAPSELERRYHFLWRFQLKHMFFRYVGWNFVGIAGEEQDSGVSVDDFFGIPLLLGLLDQLIALGCKDLTMIGGEVFLFRGWEKLSEYLTNNGIAVNIVTNGYRIGASEIEQIQRAKLVNVGVSIDGMEGNHNSIRGRSDAFRNVGNSLDLLQHSGHPGLCCNYPDEIEL